MKFISATLLVFFILSLQRCKQSEHSIIQPIVFEDYFIRYLSPGQQLKAQAIFAVGDSINNITPLSFPGGVAFQGSGMLLRKLNPKLFRYEIERTAGYTGTFKFQYKDKQGFFVSFETGMNPIEDFFLKSTVSKSKGFDIVINGGLLTAEESLVFLFSDQNNIAASVTLSGPTKSIEFHIPPKDFQHLNSGKGKLYLVKKLLRNENLDNRDIHTEIEYYTKDVEIEIEE